MRSGVYAIRNEVNGKQYIGSSVRLKIRRTHHFKALEAGVHKNRHLQAAFDKYGNDAFSFRILLFCNRSQCIEYEQLCLDKLRSEYNISPVAGSRLGVRVSNETKEKLRTISTGKRLSTEAKQKLSSAALGRKLSSEHKAKIGKGNKGKPVSSEARQMRREKSLAFWSVPENRERMKGASAGRRQSDETKEKRKAAYAAKSPEEKDKVVAAAHASWTGSKHTQETINKMKSTWARKRAERISAILDSL